MSTYTFLSYVRQGVAAAIDGAPSAASPSATVTLNTGTAINVPIRLYRPGDITGIDPRVVVRTEPRNLVTDFAPNYLSFVEFDRPDFPWLFTPPSTPPPLMPWICLVVVPKDKVPRPESPSRDALPVLTCPIRELPDLSEAWAWAHAQLLRLPGESVEQVLRDAPDRNVSRLLSPRRLDANRAYYACIVPTFRAGLAAAGLIDAPSDGDATPAWSSGPPGGGAAADLIKLPVYYFWEFATAAEGDFEDLVRRLEKGVLVRDVGNREMALSAAAPEFQDGGPTGLEGALMSPSLERREWPDREGRAFVAALERAIEAEPRAAGEPVLGPPIYGAAHAGVTSLSPAAPPWLRELNLDPRYRVAAGLGVRVVQEQQEHLMASAWEQLGEIRQANQVLHQAQLARVAGERTHAKRFAPLAAVAPARVLQVTAPVLTRVVRDGATMAHALRRSSLPIASLSPAFRRASRPHGPIARRMPRPPVSARMIDHLANGDFIIDAAPARPGLVTLDVVLAGTGPRAPTALGDFTGTAIRRRRLPPSGPSTTRPAGRGGGQPAATADSRFRDAAAAHQDKLLSLAETAPPPAPRRIDVGDHSATLLRRLKPSETLPARIGDRIRRPPNAPPPADPLAPIMASPQFPQPMYQPLRDLGHEFVLPGLDRVPPNTVAEIAVNRRFIEAYLAGLNHEMARELLWREFPTDLRATYFHRFWDPAPGSSTGEDITDVHTWSGTLGGHEAEPSAELLVLVVRGDVMKRYPGAIVYMAKAKWSSNGAGRYVNTEERHPLFRGALDPDFVFVGFHLSAAFARGTGDCEDASHDRSAEPGWYLVIQEQPTELRFGLDEKPNADPPPLLESWYGLTWAHAGADVTHLRVAGPLKDVALPLKEGASELFKWGADAATMAGILLQPPVRLLIHACTLLPTG